MISSNNYKLRNDWQRYSQRVDGLEVSIEKCYYGYYIAIYDLEKNLLLPKIYKEGLIRNKANMKEATRIARKMIKSL